MCKNIIQGWFQIYNNNFIYLFCLYKNQKKYIYIDDYNLLKVIKNIQ